MCVVSSCLRVPECVCYGIAQTALGQSLAVAGDEVNRIKRAKTTEKEARVKAEERKGLQGAQWVQKLVKEFRV